MDFIFWQFYLFGQWQVEIIDLGHHHGAMVCQMLSAHLHIACALYIALLWVQFEFAKNLKTNFG
jgi:SAM-dependent MidA family methyltransferase